MRKTRQEVRKELRVAKMNLWAAILGVISGALGVAAGIIALIIASR